MGRCFLQLVSPTTMCTGTEGNPRSKCGRPRLGQSSREVSPHVPFPRLSNLALSTSCGEVLVVVETAPGSSSNTLVLEDAHACWHLFGTIWWFVMCLRYMLKGLENNKYIDIPPATPRGARTVSVLRVVLQMCLNMDWFLRRR